MCPILLKTSFFTIHTYGFLMAVAFLVSLKLVLYRAKRQGVGETIIYDLTLVIFISGIVGSRILEVFINFSFYRAYPLEIFKIWRGGLGFYGGLITAIFVTGIFILKKRLDLWQIADLYTPAIPLGHAIGRIGCFSAGCCYGKVTSLPWGIVFKNPYSLAPLGVKVHPTQVYSLLGNLTIFFYLLQMEKNKQYKGQTFVFYTICYSILRFFIEFFRGDERGPMMGSFSLLQGISFLLLGLGIGMHYKFKKSQKEEKGSLG